MDTWVICAGLVAHRKCRNLSQTYFFSLNHWCSFVPQPWSVETTLIKYIWVISGRSLTWIQATHELHFVHEEPWLTSHLANSYSSSLITSGSLCIIVDLNFSRSLNHDTKKCFSNLSMFATPPVRVLWYLWPTGSPVVLYPYGVLPLQKLSNFACWIFNALAIIKSHSFS